MIQLSVQFTQFVFQAFSVGHISLIFIKTKKFKPLEIRTALFITLDSLSESDKIRRKSN